MVCSPRGNPTSVGFFFIQKLQHVLIVKSQETSYCFWQVEGKNNSCEISPYLLPNKGLSPGGRLYQRLIPAGERALLPLQPPEAGGYIIGEMCEGHSPETQAHKRTEI